MFIDGSIKRGHKQRVAKRLSMLVNWLQKNCRRFYYTFFLLLSLLPMESNPSSTTLSVCGFLVLRSHTTALHDSWIPRRWMIKKEKMWSYMYEARIRCSFSAPLHVKLKRVNNDMSSIVACHHTSKTSQSIKLWSIIKRNQFVPISALKSTTINSVTISLSL